jgi:tripartite-type tricarboxylate transporter receptor subunit TctC
MAGIKMTHVPYRGTAPALTDLISGQVQMVFCTIPSAIQYINAGTLRALAVTSATRLETHRELASVGETVSGFEAFQWYGMGAPTGTSAEIIAILNKEIKAGLADAKLKTRLADLGGEPLSMSPDEFGKFLAAETDKMGKVVKAAGIKVT